MPIAYLLRSNYDWFRVGDTLERFITWLNISTLWDWWLLGTPCSNSKWTKREKKNIKWLLVFYLPTVCMEQHLSNERILSLIESIDSMIANATEKNSTRICAAFLHLRRTYSGARLVSNANTDDTSFRSTEFHYFRLHDSRTRQPSQFHHHRHHDHRTRPTAFSTLKWMKCESTRWTSDLV